MNSQQLLTILKSVISGDLNNNNSVIDYFLTHNMSGGWECWLQVAYARAVVTAAQNAPNDYDREVQFPPTNQKCDLWFDAHAEIWVELKAQRNQTYANAVNDFAADIHKLVSLPSVFRLSNVLVAAAFLTLGVHGVVNPNDDRVSLNSIRTQGPAGTVRYWTYGAGAWTDQTLQILNVPLGTRVLVTFVPN